EERGEGTPLVLLHGFPFDHTIWQQQLDEVSNNTRVLAPDLPGFGKSDALPGAEPAMDDYAGRVAQWADETGLGKFVLVGHSMGGYIAFAFARLYPERLSGLGLVCTRPGPDSEQTREGRYNMIKQVRDKGAQATVDAMSPNLCARRTTEQRQDSIEGVR